MSEKESQSLLKLSKALKTSLESLKEEYAEICQELKNSGFKGDVEKTAYNILMGKHREIKRTIHRKYPLETFVGFKVGDLGVFDQAEFMRSKADRVIQTEGLETALQKGLVRIEQGKMLYCDTRPKVFGRPNKNFGAPLPEGLKIRSRTLAMLVKTSNDEKFKYARLQTNDNKLALAWNQLPFYTLVTFQAAVQRKNGDYLLSSSSAADSKTVFKQVNEEIDYFKEYEKAFKDSSIPIADLDKYHEATKSSWERYVVLRGIVAYIGFGSESFRGTPCILMDSDTGYQSSDQVMFYIPEHLKINFGTYSEVYLLGKTREIVRTDEETGKRYTAGVVVDAWGIFPIPGRLTEPKAFLEEPEEEIQAFIPIKEG